MNDVKKHRFFKISIPNILACMFGTAVVKFLDTIAVTGVVVLFYLIIPI